MATRLFVGDFQQCMACEAGVPHWRNARLAIGFIGTNHEQFLDGAARDGGLLFLVKDIEHHRGIGHRGKNRAEAVLAVEPFSDEIDGPIDRPLPQALRKYFDGWPQDHIDTAKKSKPYANSDAVPWLLVRLNVAVQQTVRRS